MNQDNSVNLTYRRWEEFNRITKVLNLWLFFQVLQLFVVACKCPDTGGTYSMWDKFMLLATPVILIAGIYFRFQEKVLEEKYIRLIKVNHAEIKKKVHKGRICIWLLYIFSSTEILYLMKREAELRNFLARNVQYLLMVIFVSYVLIGIILSKRKHIFLFHSQKNDCKYEECEMDNEFVYISSLLEKMEDEDIKKYIAHELYTYAKRARFYKYCFYLFSVISLSAPAIALVINNVYETSKYSKLFVSGLSAVATISTGVNSLVKFKETWIRYRSYCEILKREVTEYVSGVGEYGKEKITQEENEKLFYDNVSDRIKKEEKEWKTTRDKD